MYTYADYAAQPTVPLRLERARLFLGELTQLITAATSRDGASRDPAPLLQLRQQVMADIQRYEASPVMQSVRFV
jgi:hypothetical protein